jgi:hypothetical protein
VCGFEHGVKNWFSTASSSAHSYLTSAAGEEKRNVAVVLSVTSSGAEMIVVSIGGPTRQAYSAGDASGVPDESTARTSSRCTPTLRFANS